MYKIDDSCTKVFAMLNFILLSIQANASISLKYTINQSNNGHQRTKGLACSNEGEWMTTIGSTLIISNETLHQVKTWKLDVVSLELVNTYDKSNDGHWKEINDIINYDYWDDWDSYAKRGIRLFYTASDDETIKVFTVSNQTIHTEDISTREFSTKVTSLAFSKEYRTTFVARLADGSLFVSNDMMEVFIDAR